MQLIFLQTILMKDPVKDVNTDGMLQSLLSECVWGVIQPDHDHASEVCGGGFVEASAPHLLPTDWKMLSNIPSTIKPQANAITYGEYLENVVRYL